MSEGETRGLLKRLDALRESRRALERIAHAWMGFDGGLYMDTVHTVRKRWPRKSDVRVDVEYEMSPGEITHFRDWAMTRYASIDAEIASIQEKFGEAGSGG